jgi:Domain of unknown function (DUF4431)
MRPFPALIVTAVALMASASDAAECMHANDASEIAEGSLSQKTFEDANGRPEKAFILTMRVPTCLSGADESDNVKSSTTIHIYSSNDAVSKSIKKFVGKPVEVHGSAFGAITAHHHAPIVMDISEIDQI